MDRDELLEAVEERIYDLICTGGGDDESVKKCASDIVDLLEEKGED